MSVDITAVLHEHGHRVTRPRRAVWRELEAAESHLTVEQLAERIEANAGAGEGGIDLASVYRSLSLFQDLDLVRESRLGDEEAGRWELAHPDEHFHLVCERCGEIDHHVGSLVSEIRRHLVDEHQFAVDSVDLTVTGRCTDCREES